MTITTRDGMLEQIAEQAERAAWNIAETYNYMITESGTKRIVEVPDTALYYGQLAKIGGKTIVWNQLVDSGTTTVPTINGRKYYTLIDGTASIVTSDGSAISVVDDSADMVCDLTLMFGSGNEPSTTADFTAIFGATHYSYNAGTLLSAGVTSVVSKDTNNATLQTIPIPAEIQSIEGYGWSARSVYNYIDFERKVFVQNVGSVDLGTLTWSIDSTTYDYTYFVSNEVSSKLAGDSQFIAAKYVTKGHRSSLTTNMTIAPPNAGNSGFAIRNDSCTNVTELLSALNGVYAYYRLRIPQEIDISEYLTSTDIKAKSGGTLTFENSNDFDVPSEVKYIK